MGRDPLFSAVFNRCETVARSSFAGHVANIMTCFISGFGVCEKVNNRELGVKWPSKNRGDRPILFWGLDRPARSDATGLLQLHRRPTCWSL
eukprot:COSAG04_NODE_1893_length_5290_cov_1.894433_5_plen_91_part_00